MCPQYSCKLHAFFPISIICLNSVVIYWHLSISEVHSQPTFCPLSFPAKNYSAASPLMDKVNSPTLYKQYGQAMEGRDSMLNYIEYVHVLKSQYVFFWNSLALSAPMLTCCCNKFIFWNQTNASSVRQRKHTRPEKTSTVSFAST